jgi:hypothetical protein
MTNFDAKQLAQALERRFAAFVDLEEVAPGRFRFGVVSSQFVGVSQLRRQDEIWNVIDEVVPRDHRLDVSLILAFAPEEIQTAPSV